MIKFGAEVAERIYKKAMKGDLSLGYVEREINNTWNAAVQECQDEVYSDGIELHPELVARLEKLKR